jgi:hypothetical protein
MVLLLTQTYPEQPDLSDSPSNIKYLLTMAVLTFDPELIEGLGFTSKDIRDWKRYLAMRPIYEEP